MERLAACELHPAARGPGQRRLLDLLPEQRLRDWADSCGRSHAAFVEKVRTPVYEVKHQKNPLGRSRADPRSSGCQTSAVPSFLSARWFLRMVAL